MPSEQELLHSLEQQIAKIEQFVVDLQKDSKWQKIFYHKKLFLNLKQVFKHSHTEYYRYLEDIMKDYNSFKQNKNELYKTYYLNRLESKIFALFKILRNLKKFTLKQAIRPDIDQGKISSLMHQKESLEKMIVYLNNSYNNLNKQLIYGKTQEELTVKILAILEKKGRLERELFSITERLKLWV